MMCLLNKDKQNNNKMITITNIIDWKTALIIVVVAIVLFVFRNPLWDFIESLYLVEDIR